MKPIDVLRTKGRPPSLKYLLTGGRVLAQNELRVIIESSTTSQVNVKNLIEAEIGATIDNLSTVARIYISAGVTINPYSHVGATGIDAITLEGIPSDKSIIIENHGVVIGSSGLGGEGTHSGSNQTRNGQVGHGGSCVKMVDLEFFLLLNNGIMYGGKGVGANGSGGRGGTTTGGTTWLGAGFNGCSPIPPQYPSITSVYFGQAGVAGEWDGYGAVSFAPAIVNGTTANLPLWSRTLTVSCTNSYEYQLSSSAYSSTPGKGMRTIGSSTDAGALSSTFTNAQYEQGSLAFRGVYPANCGSAGGAGGKGTVAAGYGQSGAGGAGGSAGGAAGANITMTATLSGSDWIVTGTGGGDNNGPSGSAGSTGSDGFGGGCLTNATIGSFFVVNNGTILSGKDLDSNRGGYLL